MLSCIACTQNKKVTKTFAQELLIQIFFFICLHYAKTELQGLNVFIDIGNGKNRRLIDVTGYASSLSIGRYSTLLDCMLSLDVTLSVVLKELEK